MHVTASNQALATTRGSAQNRYRARNALVPVFEGRKIWETRAKCEHYVKLAVENDARVATGGRAPPHLDQGYYFEPTLLDLPDNSNPAAQDEIFGPVVSVIGYRDLDHAIAMANDSRYALSGYVYGADRGMAVNVAMRIRSGTVHVNTGVMSTYASFGGHRASGIGRERGIEGLRLFQQLSCLSVGG